MIREQTLRARQKLVSKLPRCPGPFEWLTFKSEQTFYSPLEICILRK
jgi:hypothetical protein